MKLNIVIAAVLYFLLSVAKAHSCQYCSFTKSWEGYSPVAYADADGESIGYGFHLNRPDAGRMLKAAGVEVEIMEDGVFWNHKLTVTHDQARAMLHADMLRVMDDCRSMFADFDLLPRNVRFVIADLRYNLGPHRFRQFKRFIEAAQAQDWTEAAAELKDSKWYGQVGRRGRHHYLVMIGAGYPYLAQSP